MKVQSLYLNIVARTRTVVVFGQHLCHYMYRHLMYLIHIQLSVNAFIK